MPSSLIFLYNRDHFYHCLSSLYVYVLAIRKTINESSTSFSHLYYLQERWTVQQELNNNAWQVSRGSVGAVDWGHHRLKMDGRCPYRAQFLGVVKRDHAKLIWQAHTETNTSCSSRSFYMCVCDSITVHKYKLFRSKSSQRSIQKFRNKENNIGLYICLIRFYRQVDEVKP